MSPPLSETPETVIEAVAATPEEERRFPCAQCGANLRYAPGQTSMSCSYCGHEQDIPGASAEKRASALAPIPLARALQKTLPDSLAEETQVLSCTGCGAQVEFEPATHAAECPFCGTPVVTGTGTNRHLKPQGVLPFRLQEKEAREAFVKWLRSLWFAPNGLKAYARADNRFAGIYVPYWSFDADTATRYAGQRGTHYYTGTGKERTRHTRWTNVSGRVSRRFDDVLVMASESLPRRYVRALQPWNLDAVEPYRADFLSGFRAEAYSVGVEPGFAIARDRMEEIVRGDVRRAIGGDEQRITTLDMRTSGEAVKHLLLPIWVAAYRYRDKSFRFVVNAQTGRVRGERPWSPWKIAFAVLLAVAVVAGLGIVFGEG